MADTVHYCTKEAEIVQMSESVEEIRAALLGDFEKQGIVSKVRDLHKIVVTGNGEPSIVRRVELLERGRQSESRPVNEDGSLIERRVARTVLDMAKAHGPTTGIVATLLGIVEALRMIGWLP